MFRRKTELTSHYDELVTPHDQHVGHTTATPNLSLRELARRDAEAQGACIEALTETMAWQSERVEKLTEKMAQQTDRVQRLTESVTDLTGIYSMRAS